MVSCSRPLIVREGASLAVRGELKLAVMGRPQTPTGGGHFNPGPPRLPACATGRKDWGNLRRRRRARGGLGRGRLGLPPPDACGEVNASVLLGPPLCPAPYTSHTPCGHDNPA